MPLIAPDASEGETSDTDSEALVREDWRALNGIPCIVGGIKALVASLGGTLHARTGDHFPWKTLPGELERLGYVFVNYPEGVLMPGEARHPYARVNGVRDLVAGPRDRLVYALKSGTLTIRAVTDGAGRARLTTCEDPVVVGEAPPARSMHSHGRRMFADGRIDRDGLPRLPPMSPHLLPRPSQLPPGRIKDEDEDHDRGQDEDEDDSEDEDEDEDQNQGEDEGDDEGNKGKARASVESVRSRNDDISTDNLRPTKRPRLEEVVTAARRHEQFWIVDGNTVLEVGGVAFKLHRSRLVDQSTFFAGLLGEQNVHTPDGVVVERDENGTVYHLSNTTPEDFEALLQFDKNPMTYYLTPPLFPALAAILRAATVLGFDTHRAFGVKLLENTWSSSLADLTTDIQPHAVEVVLLARSCGIKSILKRAFYEMVRVAGYGLSDGELVDGDGKKDQEISRADERRLERMRETLISTWLEVATRVDRSVICPHESKGTSGGPASTEPSSSTTHPSKCPSLSLKREAWERRVHDSGLHNQYLLDPLCGLQALIDIKWEDEGWCSECVRAKREVWTRVRQQTWQRVGVCMGLEA